MATTKPVRAWTVAEAEAQLSEVLRLAEEEGPQRIGASKSFVVVPERMWLERDDPPRMPMGKWLVENLPRGTNLEIPKHDGYSHREIPFADWTDQDWGDR